MDGLVWSQFASVFSLVLPTLRLNSGDIYHLACAFFWGGRSSRIKKDMTYILHTFLYQSEKMNDGLLGLNFQ